MKKIKISPCNILFNIINDSEGFYISDVIEHVNNCEKCKNEFYKGIESEKDLFKKLKAQLFQIITKGIF